MAQNDKKKIKTGDLPRPGSVIYNFHFRDEFSKKKKLRRWQKLNKYFMIPLYRLGVLPLLGFGWAILILTTIGWKDGKKRRTPLEYRRFEDVITIFSAMGEKSGWVKNLHANPEDVVVRHGFHRYKCHVEFITEKNQKISLMKCYVSEFGKSAKILFGWNPKEDNQEEIDFSKLLGLLSIIQLHRNPK
ncbi:MAG: nitroreductase family deazaflavin-dependent oxidoreductase [Candidatus Lokiarchaeota archaeon]|nr:nitroreductase family deazaflavin-dependent oxidoreductase [Candidatus Lokiarchaeota archaeon]